MRRRWSDLVVYIPFDMQEAKDFLAGHDLPKQLVRE